LRTKRWVTSVSFPSDCYAIGRTLVAELTNSIAVMKAAAKAVAVSRPGAKMANIVETPFLETLDWVRAALNAGSVPIRKYRVFSTQRCASM
jgi:hypothetical protein